MDTHKKEQQANKNKVTINVPNQKKNEVVPDLQFEGNQPETNIQRVGMHSNTLTQADILVLQRTIGNEEVSRLFTESKNPNQSVNNQPGNNSQSAAHTVSKKQSGDERPIVQRIKHIKNQDEVQKYLAKIAPSSGPIREYIDEHAEENGGLCAGWVVLHRKYPDKLINMWERVSQAIIDKKEDLGIKTDEAVELYIEAQFHFANDPENKEIVAPDDAVLSAAGLKDTLQDETNIRRSDKKGREVKYGKIYDTVQSILKNYKGSKKHLFVEIYTKSHTAQIELKSGKLYSICETEKAGVRKVVDPKLAEQILTSAFFDEDDEDATMRLHFDVFSA